MKLSAAQVVARIRDRFDLGRQSARHSDASLIDKFNDAARMARRELFARGSQAGIAVVTFDSDDADDVSGEYPGQRIDSFGDGSAGEKFAEAIRSVECLDSGGYFRILPELTIDQAADNYVSDAATGSPVGFFLAGPVEETNGATVAVFVTPRLPSAQDFRIRYLPPFTPIAAGGAGCDDLLIPFEWIMWEVGVAIAIRDDDAQLVSMREARRNEARDRAISAIGLSQSSQVTRSTTGRRNLRGLLSNL